LTPPLRLRPIVAFLILLLAAAPSSAQHSLWLPTPQTDATEFASAALDPSEGLVLPPRALVVSAQLTYFNQWAGSWHTARILEASGSGRGVLTDADIRRMDDQFSGEEIYRVDVEGWRMDTLLAWGVGNVTLAARLPWIGIGAPGGDSVAEAFHRIFPVADSYDREVFARGQTMVLLRGAGGRITRSGELNRSGIGDIVVSAALPVLRSASSAHAATISLSAPTGQRGTLHGSGGWDGGLRWFSTWSGGKRHYVAAAGWTYLDRNGDLLGVPRADLWNLYAGVEQPLGRSWSTSLRARVDSSPLAEASREDLGKPAIYYRVGVHYLTRGAERISFEFADEVAPQWGIDADWSIHVAVSRLLTP
jgi:hypothetical protein